MENKNGNEFHYLTIFISHICQKYKKDNKKHIQLQFWLKGGNFTSRKTFSTNVSTRGAQSSFIVCL